MQGYTGTYKGVRVSVMASGMGIRPSPSYAYRLYTQYGVENIIRVGSAGRCARPGARQRVRRSGACTNSTSPASMSSAAPYAPFCDFDLLSAAVESAKELGVKMPVGNLYSPTRFTTRRAATPALKQDGHYGQSR